MAKAKTTTAKVGNTTIRNLTDGDRKQVEAAKAAPKADTTETAARANTRTTTAAPEAQNTAREATLAANRLFEKADDDGKAAIISQTAARNAALGY